MSRFRKEKERLRVLCLGRDWKMALEAAIPSSVPPREAVNPLLALLSRPECRWQAAYGLGLAVPLLAREDMEGARIIMRRMMWSLNEESGNLAWGTPEAMACILAQSPALAREYARIFLSYGYETGGEDNFLDYAPLRRGVIWGMGHVARADAAFAGRVVPHLSKALSDEDGPIRAFAAWSLGRAAVSRPEEIREGAEKEEWLSARRELEKALERESALPEVLVEYFDGQALCEGRAQELMQSALKLFAH